MGRDELERRLAGQEAGRQEAAARLELVQQRIDELEQERARMLGEAHLARRALAELEDAVGTSREELAALGLREAREALEDAVQARDRLVEATAAAFDTAASLFRRIGEERDAVAAAHRELASLGVGDDVPPEPDVLHEAWTHLEAEVTAQLEAEREHDLVDAAARTDNRTVNQLPEHLRASALERRRELRARSR